MAKKLIGPAHHQLSVLYAFDGDEPFCQGSESFRFPQDGHGVKAEIAIHVVLGRRKDERLVVLLHLFYLKGDFLVGLVVH